MINLIHKYTKTIIKKSWIKNTEKKVMQMYKTILMIILDIMRDIDNLTSR